MLEKYHITKWTRNSDSKQNNCCACHQSILLREGCFEAMKPQIRANTSELENGLGDRRLRDAIRRLPIRSPKASHSLLLLHGGEMRTEP
jgi:hypothetical protein